MLGAGAKTDSAVSPVIGVMLLLAIVIIIAALVASFAGGAADTKEKAPSVDPAVYTAGSGQNFTLVFEHRGGDQVRIEDLRVNTWVHLPDGDLRPASHEGDELKDSFGLGTWRAGVGVNTGGLDGTARFLGVEKEELSGYIDQSVTVDVAVYHLPSGALLHKSSLLLKER
jgi:flagellin-like protein